MKLPELEGLTGEYHHDVNLAYEQGKRDTVPEGWIAVPKEPTPAMRNAAGKAIWNATYWGTAYKVMITAAPKQEK